MPRSLGSFFSAHVLPYVTDLVSQFVDAVREDPAYAGGRIFATLVLLLLVVLLVRRATRRRAASGAAKVGSDAAVVAQDDVAPTEPLPVPEHPVAVPELRRLLASVQDVLPGAPMRFVADAAEPAEPAEPADPTADVEATSPALTAVPDWVAALRDEPPAADVPNAPAWPSPETTAAAASTPSPATEAATAPLTPVPALFDAFAEFSQLSSARRAAAEEQDGAA